ncbi:T9SS type A sorting domain-containing protein [bacterium SCSIO 12741]|nr:T9SS type A sorting domain-containing protein [bacterium SCSIO 12741]
MRKIYSLVLLVSALMFGNLANAQYCSPSFGDCWGYISSVTTTGGVTNLNMQGLSANSSGPNYHDNTGTDTLVMSRAAVTFTVNMSTCFSSSTWSGGRLYLWADWNGNNIFDNPAELIASNTSTAPFPQTKTFTINPPNNPAKNTTRARLMINQANPCYSGFGDGNVVDFTISYSVPYSVSPGKLVSPGNPACSGSTDLIVTVENTGQNDLTKGFTLGGVIHYGVSGTTTRLRDTIPDSFYTVPILSGSETAPINMYSFSNGFNPGDTIYIWATFPDSLPDDNTTDDTLCTALKAVVPGTHYSVGDTNHFAYDFHTLSDAIDYLNSFGAICDSVIFMLADTVNLTSRGHYEIDNILGTSYINTITFRPIDTNTTEVIVLGDSAYSSRNYTLKCSASHINFEGINFVSTNVINQTGYHSVIALEDGAHHVSFEDCSFTTDLVTNTSNRGRKQLVYTDSKVGRYIEFDECLFYGGSDAIYLIDGDSIMIEDCVFEDQYWMSIRLEDFGATLIDDNWFRSKSTYASSTNTVASIGTAIFLDGVHGELHINGNAILSSNGQWPRYGISTYDYNAIGKTCHISNNMINVGQPWSSLRYHPIAINNSVGVEAYHNTFVATGNSSDNAGVHIEGGANHQFYNNIFASMLTGKAMISTTAAAILNSDNNDLYVNPGQDVAEFNGTSQATLADWQLSSSLDANSITANPNFFNVAQNDLHVCNDSLFQGGVPIASVMYDFDGDMRDASAPCMGADEFAPVEFFSLGDDYGLCPGDSTVLKGGNNNFGDRVIWKDLGTGQVIDSTQFLVVHQPGDYEVTLLNACGILVDSITIIDPDMVVLPNDTNQCPMTTISYDASIVDGDIYVWSTGDSTANITVTAEDKYTVTVTDVWGCITMDSVNVTYSNAADMGSDTAIICQGVAIQLFGGTPDGPDVSYTWDGFLGSGAETGDNVFVDYIQVNDTDTVVCNLDHRGCTTSDTIYTFRETPPDASQIVWSTNGLAFHIDQNNTSATTHLWVFGDGDTSDFPEPRHLYGSSGTYTVWYYSTNDCGTDSASYEVMVEFLGVDENGGNMVFTLFPNPNHGQFQVDFTDVNAENAQMVITDVQGKVIANRNLGSIYGTLTENFALNLESGVYFIKVTLDDQVHNAKFTVE